MLRIQQAGILQSCPKIGRQHSGVLQRRQRISYGECDCGPRRRICLVQAVISDKTSSSSGATVSTSVTPSENGAMVNVRAVVLIRKKLKEDIKSTIYRRWESLLDGMTGQNILLELVSTDVDPVTKSGKISKGSGLRDWREQIATLESTADFMLSADFGQPRAILVTNKHQSDFFLEAIVLEGFAGGAIYFPCHSWVHSTKDNPEKRIFFSNETYLPSKTPDGLKDFRQKDMIEKRGEGKGERKPWDRIYDYAKYNDLGRPDESDDLARPIIGTSEHPYPRRCRTGRPSTKTGENLRFCPVITTDHS